MFVEQAIFTSTKTRRQEGYQLASMSAGIGGELTKELEVWGPAHDSLLDPAQGSTSINFHPLSTGDYCVSRTVAAGEEYSGRGGPRVYTQMLVVPPEVLSRFANNPFALLEAALASGQLPVHDQPPPQLEPVRLLGRASPVNKLRLAELIAEPGVEVLFSLLRLAVESPALAALSTVPLARLYAGLFSLLPVHVRPDFSLSTGLRYSQRRPVRLLALPDDSSEQRNLQRVSGAVPLDCSNAKNVALVDLQPGWAKMVFGLFQSGQIKRLPYLLQIAELHAGSSASLDELALAIEGELQLCA